MPHVIEPAAGADRATLAFLVDAYDEELVEREGTGAGETRTVLRLHPRLAPVKAAVLPARRQGRASRSSHARSTARCAARVQAEYDEGGAIGKRYRRQDEIGTPFCLTIDHQSLRGPDCDAARARLALAGTHPYRRDSRRRSSAASRRRGNHPSCRTSGQPERRGMDFDLTDEQRLIKDTAREFTDNEIDRAVARKRAQPSFRPRDRRMLAGPGLSRGDRPDRVRRRGARLPELWAVVEEIGRGCSSVRTVISVQTSLVCSAILKWGTEEQKLAYLPKLCSGEWLGLLRADRARHGL